MKSELSTLHSSVHLYMFLAAVFLLDSLSLPSTRFFSFFSITTPATTTYPIA